MHISTDEVYGEILKGSSSENQMFDPSNPYSGTKAASVDYSSYLNIDKKKILIIRSNNIYGTRQHQKTYSCNYNETNSKSKIPVHGMEIIKDPIYL